jgi:hypothetical protein
VAYEGTVMLPDFSSVPVETPRALETSEIAGIVKDFATGAQHAKEAGFDGVEIHGANSYLIDQFLRDGCNQRTDAYGGSIENRARFALEVVDAVVAVWGPGLVGIRLSPSSPWNGMRDSDPVALYTYLAHELAKRPLAYVHVNESATAPADVAVLPAIRAAYPGTIIAATAYTAELAESAIAEGAPIWSRSVCRTSPTRISSSASPPGPSSTPPIPRRSTAAPRRATRTTRRWSRRSESVHTRTAAGRHAPQPFVVTRAGIGGVGVAGPRPPRPAVPRPAPRT